MIQIDWEEYKQYKNDFQNAEKFDNFGILLYFLKNYYNIKNVETMFEVLVYDELSKMMLDKRDIFSANELESYLLELSRS